MISKVDDELDNLRKQRDQHRQNEESRNKYKRGEVQTIKPLGLTAQHAKYKLFSVIEGCGTS